MTLVTSRMILWRHENSSPRSSSVILYSLVSAEGIPLSEWQLKQDLACSPVSCQPESSGAWLYVWRATAASSLFDDCVFLCQWFSIDHDFAFAGSAYRLRYCRRFQYDDTHHSQSEENGIIQPLSYAHGNQQLINQSIQFSYPWAIWFITCIQPSRITRND